MARPWAKGTRWETPEVAALPAAGTCAGAGRRPWHGVSQRAGLAGRQERAVLLMRCPRVTLTGVPGS